MAVFDPALWLEAPVRDFVLHLSLRGHFQVRWSEPWLNTYEGLLKKHFGAHQKEGALLKHSVVSGTMGILRRDLRAYCINGVADLDDAVGTQSEGEALKVALACPEADTIVVHNGSDLLKAESVERFQGLGLRCLGLDDFLDGIVNRETKSVFAVATRIVSSLGDNAFPLVDWMRALARSGIPKSMDSLSRAYYGRSLAGISLEP